MPRISGDHTSTYSINSNGKKYIFTNTFHGHDPANLSIREQGNGNTITMNGLVESVAGYSSMSLSGTNVTLRIGVEGILRGEGSALTSSGTNAHIANEGLIVGTADYGGIFLSGDETSFRNRGTITCGGDCIIFNGGGSVVINERGGVIAVTDHAGLAAISMIGAMDETLRLVNHGTISVRSGHALFGGDSDDKVRNTGAIIGDFSLGKGDDLVDNRGGVIHGVVQGGVGDDTLITNSYRLRFVEASGEGEDQVRSTVSYTLDENVEQLVLLGRKNLNGTGSTGSDLLYGNAGNNHIQGRAGFDTIDGKGGNDVLYGGNDADRFYFNKGYDRDTIDDFQQGSDRVYIDSWAALSTFQEVKNHASNHGQDVWISVGDDTLIIKALHKADLTTGDFFFF